MEELNYENMMALAKKYCDMLPGLIPETKHEMEALCAPDCIFSYPDGETEAEHVSKFWKELRFYLRYEPHPCYIHVDDRQMTADCVLKEEVRHPETQALLQNVVDTNTGYKLLKNDVDAKTGFPIPDILYMRESFGFKLHDGKVKIKDIFMGPMFDGGHSAVAWQRWRDLYKPMKEGIEPGLTYEKMMALIKKYCDMLPGLSPDRKHEMEAICTPDCIFSYPDYITEADFVSSRWKDECRYHLLYEPHPCFIHVDERKHTADCVFREEVRHPETGELIKDYWDKWKPGLGGVVYLRESFGFQLHEGEVKINNVFMGPRIDTNDIFMSGSWTVWRDLCKP